MVLRLRSIVHHTRVMVTMNLRSTNKRFSAHQVCHSDCSNHVGCIRSLAFPQRGGTLASKIQLNVSSRSEDMTTRPLIPFSRSIRDDLMIRNRALKRSIYKGKTKTRLMAGDSLWTSSRRGRKKFGQRSKSTVRMASEARLYYYAQDCTLMRCIL